MMFKTWKTYAGALLAVLVILVGCRGSFERGAGEETATRRPEKITDDPLGMSADFAVVPGHATEVTIDSAATNAAGGAVDSVRINMPGQTGDRTESYRIQLFTSKTYQPAMTELKIAREVFDKKVWLDYEVPYYKVRVGDFPDREAAEKYVPAAAEAGYKNAWVVKVNVGMRRLEGIYDNADIAPYNDSLGVMNADSTENVNDTTQYPQDQPVNPGD